MRRKRGVGVGLCVLLLSAAAAYAQGMQQQQPPPTIEQRVQRAFTAVMNKLVAIAKDIPEELFDYRPHPDARSVLEEIWHVTAANRALVIRARGEQVPREVFSTEGKPRDRAGLVAALEASVAEASALLADPATAGLGVGTLEHAGEHYGKLVTIYRINGLVPPASRR